MAPATLEEPVWPVGDGNENGKRNYMLTTGYLSDAVLVIGLQKQEVKVHRMILESKCIVFRDKFLEAGCNRLDLVEEDPKTFLMFIRYLYLEEIDAEIEDIIWIVKIATEYKVQELKQLCLEQLKPDNFTDENVLKLYDLSMTIKCKDAIKVTLAYFCRNAKSLVDQESFLTLRPECLYEILEQDDLKLESEFQLFQALLRWGKSECRRIGSDPDVRESLQKVLKKALSRIRFPLMTNEEILNHVVQSGVLNYEDLQDMFSFMDLSIKERTKLQQGRWTVTPRDYDREDNNNGR